MRSRICLLLLEEMEREEEFWDWVCLRKCWEYGTKEEEHATTLRSEAKMKERRKQKDDTPRTKKPKRQKQVQEGDACKGT